MEKPTKRKATDEDSPPATTDPPPPSLPPKSQEEIDAERGFNENDLAICIKVDPSPLFILSLHGLFLN
jgi:hypothetical protein